MPDTIVNFPYFDRVNDELFYTVLPEMSAPLIQDAISPPETEVYSALMERISNLEDELYGLKRKFTSELIKQCSVLISEREFAGMTHEEFDEAIQKLLLGR